MDIIYPLSPSIEGQSSFPIRLLLPSARSNHGRHVEVRERRDQIRHPRYAAPKLLATRPNQLWSWDIERHEALSTGW
ncbi:MAG: hypothetical protein A2W26_13785 [Acidobacteria bacterium RBG_16_64_8]|nr:MAG: hypothetical protein A2W26_13785 [Acidobacteria bacterium RBG_16_64_8]